MLIRVRQSGFNLIEAIVTLAVLGILVATAVPSMGEWVRGSHVRNLAKRRRAACSAPAPKP
ncbi:prepilin-type N-terminal cleavage/methylation domain-containing protein [Ramlibacter terrae]|uniref:Prepilin-type N-terminal cleavage/methylation domain-containing protein n=1 Tax=Ramlibacter terrae TaxID=2732511 RepID=A0ABX6P0E9_9BURK|nr:prepilin-type N-terminal cleavage/methylation domain-containing protein [Ramlibacter terrae]